MNEKPELASSDEIREQLFKSMGDEATQRYEKYQYVISDLEIGVKVSMQASDYELAKRLQTMASELNRIAVVHAAGALTDNENSEAEVQAVDPTIGLFVGSLKGMMKENFGG